MFRTIRFAVCKQHEEIQNLPVASAEDVEFSEALADEEDRQAQRRAAEADRRAAMSRDVAAADPNIMSQEDVR